MKAIINHTHTGPVLLENNTITACSIESLSKVINTPVEVTWINESSAWIYRAEKFGDITPFTRAITCDLDIAEKLELGQDRDWILARIKEEHFYLSAPQFALKLALKIIQGN